MTDQEPLVTVFESSKPSELGMARSILEAAEIPCTVSGGSASSYLTAYLGGGFAGVQTLVVPAELVERALAALDVAFGDMEDNAPPDGAVV